MAKKIEYNKVVKFDTLKEMMELSVKDAAKQVAFKYRDEKEKDRIIDVTYEEFQNDTFYLGTALSSVNMTSNHIAVIGDNSYKWLTVYLTVLKSDGVIVPIDKELTAKEIINVVNRSESEVLFYAEKYEQYIEEFKKELPNVKYFIGFSREKDEENVLSYDSFKASGKEKYEAGDKSYVLIEHNDTNKLKMLVFTSGTTGNPKGVMLTEHNLVSAVYYGLQVADIKTRCLSVLPYHHTYESVVGILVAIHRRATICINDSLKNVLKNLNTFKPDYIYVVPAFTEKFYKSIWANAEKSGKDKLLKIMIPVSNGLRKIGIDLRGVLFKSVHEAFGGNLKQIVCGGAPIRPEIGKFFNDIGMMLLNGYGISECSPLVSVNREKLNDPSTVGVILPCCEVKIENPNEDGDGEIWVKGDIVMMGYYKEPEKTAKVLKDGWFNTEDYGRINKKGQLVINGRKKNVIVLNNGKNIYPEEIENYVMRVPYIQEAIVKAVKNDQGQEISLCAEVFLNQEKVKELGIENIEETLKKDVSKATRDLPVWKRVTKTEIRETEFNKTTTNKIKR
mgnify:CR=1 FL=1